MPKDYYEKRFPSVQRKIRTTQYQSLVIELYLFGVDLSLSGYETSIRVHRTHKPRLVVEKGKESAFIYHGHGGTVNIRGEESFVDRIYGDLMRKKAGKKAKT